VEPDDPQPTRPPPAVGARRRLLATLLGGAVLAAAVIGGILLLRGDSDDQTDYNGAVADRFLAVCTADATDAGFNDPGGFCRCSYDRIRAEIPFERFVEIDAAMRDDPTAVPDEIDRIRTECFVEAASATPSTVTPATDPSVTTTPPGG
jgi:hypothetical protein